MRIVSERLADTVSLGRAVGLCARPSDVIALDGELGAGKTQFVRGLAEGMGLDPRQVSSPTFVFVQEYVPDETHGTANAETTDTPVLVHIDAYRLDSAEQLDSIGWSEELRAGAVLAVEWAERIRGALDGDVLTVAIEHLGGDCRALTLTPTGTWGSRMSAIEERLT